MLFSRVCSVLTEHLTSVLGNEGTEDERGDGGELDENVDGGTGGILEWISDSISDNSGGVLGVLLADNSVGLGVDGVGHVVTGLLSGEVRVVGELSGGITLSLEGIDEVLEHTLVGISRSLEHTSFNHLLAVIPSTTSVGGGESNLDSRDDDSCEETSGAGVSEDHTDSEG